MFIFFLKFTYGERAQCASNARVTLKISGRIIKSDYTIGLISGYYKAACEREIVGGNYSPAMVSCYSGLQI